MNKNNLKEFEKLQYEMITWVWIGIAVCVVLIFFQFVYLKSFVGGTILSALTLFNIVLNIRNTKNLKRDIDIDG